MTPRTRTTGQIIPDGYRATRTRRPGTVARYRPNATAPQRSPGPARATTKKVTP